MYVTVVPNRRSRPAVLLRESYREDGQVKNRTLANLTDWPPARVDALRELLRGGVPTLGADPQGFEISSSRPHGHVAAVLGVLRSLGVLDAFDASPRVRALVEALIAARLLRPASKLSLSRDLRQHTRTSTL